MVQDFVSACFRWIEGFTDTMLSLAPWIVALFAVCVAAWISVQKLLPNQIEIWKPSFQAQTGRLKGILGTAVLCALLCGSLVQTRKMVESRRDAIEGASASRRNEPSLSDVTQYSPSIAMLEEKTYTRRLTIPPQLLERVGVDGVQVLSPYLTDPSEDKVIKLADSFRRSGSDVVFERQLTRLAESPVSTDTADVSLTFKSQSGQAGGMHYVVDFKSTYQFTNRLATPGKMRFSFPMPQGGGTMQGFVLQVAGTKVVDPDESNQYSWTGDVPSGGSVVATVQYRLTGAGGYGYALGSVRRRIGRFKLVATSDRAPQFGRSGIFPDHLSQGEAAWNLNDVMTAQSVSLVFPRADLGAELLDKTLWWLPVVVGIFALAVSVLRKPSPVAVGLFGAGMLGVPVLSSYMSPNGATLVGCVAAALLASASLRDRTGVVVAIGCSVLGMAFMTGENGSLLVWTVALLAGIVALAARRRPE